MPIKQQTRNVPTAAVRERGKVLMLRQLGVTPEGRELLAHYGSPEAVGQAIGLAVASSRATAASPVFQGQTARARGKALMAEEVRRQGMTPKR